MLFEKFTYTYILHFFNLLYLFATSRSLQSNKEIYRLLDWRYSISLTVYSPHWYQQVQAKHLSLLSVTFQKFIVPWFH